mmetsp:Transcript_34685/g.51057  ORF Transcript_34685/g.51057 Transcript_34685/m.51057 type:complete len:203 (+) Transcript_34685:1147-1755(+)
MLPSGNDMMTSTSTSSNFGGALSPPPPIIMEGTPSGVIIIMLVSVFFLLFPHPSPPITSCCGGEETFIVLTREVKSSIFVAMDCICSLRTVTSVLRRVTSCGGDWMVLVVVLFGEGEFATDELLMMALGDTAAVTPLLPPTAALLLAALLLLLLEALLLISLNKSLRPLLKHSCLNLQKLRCSLSFCKSIFKLFSNLILRNP